MIVLQMVLGLLAVLGLALIILWIVGGREPVYAYCNVSPVWFAAIKYRGVARAKPALAPGVALKWAVDADFTFIGVGEPYWDRFILIAGGDAAKAPLALGDDVDDAYVARLKIGKPPRIVLGVIRCLVVFGLWRMPEGELMTDTSALGFRPEVMPPAEATARLLAQPDDYKPAMVNFLKYHPAARYAQARPGVEPVSGRAAYARYGIVALQTVYRTGGHLVFFGQVAEVLREAHAGLTAGEWDDIAVMQYPKRESILTMELLPRYRAALVHRDAGLEKTVIVASSK